MTEGSGPEPPRQRVVRVPGSRRARLTPVPGSDPAPEEAGTARDEAPVARTEPKGPNDEQLLRDVPPHY